MSTRDEPVEIAVPGDRIAGTFVIPHAAIPGVLFVHGWGGDQEQYLHRAREIAALGCVCLTIDLRGHAGTHEQRDLVTRGDNLDDITAAYDRLVAHRMVDRSAIAVVGSSYGAYLAALLTKRRPVNWLGLRVPALYPDTSWDVPKQHLDRDVLHTYRRSRIEPCEDRALHACSEFEGDALIVESEHDETVPHMVIHNYVEAFTRARSLTYRCIDGADHGLSSVESQHAYTSVLVRWLGEMVFSARAAYDSPRVAAGP